MKRVGPTAATALVLACTARAHAEPKSAEAATARALFYEARALMKDGRYAIACPKLEESLRLEHGVGTEYNLADCNERIGRLATAWSGFVSVASAANRNAQPERERVARARAKALEPRLPRIAIDVPPGAPTGLEVHRDEVSVGSGAWGALLPVDPGAHTITARAPGRQPWTTGVTVAEGQVARVALPPEFAHVASPPSAPPTITSSSIAPSPEPTAPSSPPDFPAPVVGDGTSSQRAIGWIVSGIGVGGLGVGLGFGVDSLQRRDRARSHCAGDLCDARGVELRTRAIKSGNVATVATVAGSAALIGGLVLVLTAPRATPRRYSASLPSLRAVPQVAANGGGISVEGILP